MGEGDKDTKMKIKEGYVIRKVMGNNVVIATGEASRNFHGMIKLNDTAREIWEYIENGLNEDEICALMTEKYEVDAEMLKEDVRKTLDVLEKQGIIEI